MRIAGIICEYNPFHRGHQLQLKETVRQLGEDGAVVCLMSGNYVQRGEPALFDKQLRAEAAVRSGADLVLELPVTIAVNAAGYFARGGVACLARLGCIDSLSFGSECGDSALLEQTAELLLRPDFDDALREALTEGCSFAAARSKALEKLGGDGGLLAQPNNALAVDYLCAVRQLGASMKTMTVHRDLTIPSASELRAVLRGKGLKAAAGELPEAALYNGATMHTLLAGERAMLAILRTMEDEAFRQLPFGAEGLWSKVMKACRREPGLEEILSSCKSKRYTHSRLRRMLLCGFLGLTEADLHREIPYLRILACNDRGREVLRLAAEKSDLPLVAGAIPDTPEAKAYFALESRAADLYPLFAEGAFHVPVGRERGRHPIIISGPETK